MLILLEKSFSQGRIVTWGRIWLNTPHFCQSIRDDIFNVKELSLALGTATATFGTAAELTSPLESCDFIGYGGYYRAYYSWQLKQIVE
jgi:hypothetical protein